MPFVAYLDDQRFDATAIPHEQWRALNKHPDYRRLTLLECGSRAKRVTRLGTQYFAHIAECEVNHKSETSQHMALKAILVARINALPGWRAEPEHPAPDRSWIADVMAIHDTGRRVAFEVQLSEQTQEDYAHRSQRYFDAGILPVWLTPRLLEHMDLRVPYIRIGIDKTAALPEDRRRLLLHEAYQTLLRREATVEATVRWVLHPHYTWPHGDPRQQAEEAARREAAWIRRQEQLERQRQEQEQARAARWRRAGKPKAAPSRRKRSMEPPAAGPAEPAVPSPEQVFWSWYLRRVRTQSGQPLPGKPSFKATVATRPEHHPMTRHPHLQRVRLVAAANGPAVACIGYPQNRLGPGWEESFREMVYIVAFGLGRVDLTQSLRRTPVRVLLRPDAEPQGAGAEILVDRKNPMRLQLQVHLDEMEDTAQIREWVIESLVAARREVFGTWRAVDGKAFRGASRP